MMKFLRILLFPLLVSCASGHGFRFDVDTTPAEKAATAAAVEDWNKHTVKDAQMRIDPKGDYRVTFTLTDLPQGLDGRECTYVGTDCAEAKWIRVRRGYSDKRTFTLIHHEVGHAIGLKHVVDPKALMFGPGRVEDDAVISIPDLQECQRVGSCSAILVR